MIKVGKCILVLINLTRLMFNCHNKSINHDTYDKQTKLIWEKRHTHKEKKLNF